MITNITDTNDMGVRVYVFVGILQFDPYKGQ